SRRRKGWEQPVFEFNKITGSAAAKLFTTPIFTSYPLLEEKRLELRRQGESCRRRNITRSQRSCARPGRNKEVTSDRVTPNAFASEELRHAVEFSVRLSSIGRRPSPSCGGKRSNAGRRRDPGGTDLCANRSDPALFVGGFRR